MKTFNIKDFYDSYPKKIILRPGYPARAQFKSTFMWDHYGKYIMKELESIKSYADIGGCFGFGANAMAFHISNYQGFYPATKVFEMSHDFITVRKLLFPYIEFIQEEFEKWNGNPQKFDLVTLFDVVEHLPDPELFLSELSSRTKLALLKTPMETTGEWRGNRKAYNQSKEHPDGHINFFTPQSYLKLLRKSNLVIIKGKLIRSIVLPGAERILNPESSTQAKLRLTSRKLIFKIINNPIVPYKLLRKILGRGDFIHLVRSSKIIFP